MTQNIDIKYMFRKPKFPLIGSFEGHFISAKNTRELSRKLSKISLKDDAYNFLDITAEGWVLYTEHMIISPVTLKKRWTKKEFIALFNERKNLDLSNGEMYSEKSLSSKRVHKIIYDLVEMS